MIFWSIFSINSVFVFCRLSFSKPFGICSELNTFVLFIFSLVISAYDVEFGVLVVGLFALSLLARFVMGWFLVCRCFWELIDFLLLIALK